MLLECRRCAEVFEFTTADSIDIVSSRDYVSLKNLLTKSPRGVLCPACDATVGPLPLVVVDGQDWSTGVAEVDQPANVVALRHCYDTAVVETRRILSELLNDFVVPLSASFAAGSGPEFVSANWRRWTAEITVAWRLAKEGILTNPDALPDLSDLAPLHVIVLLNAAAEVDGGGLPLADALERYVPADAALETTALLSGLRRTWGDPIEGDSGPSPAGRWAVSAIIAAASHAAGRADPDPDVTARDYLLFAVARHLGNVPERFDLALPATRLRELIDPVALLPVAVSVIDALGPQGGEVVGALASDSWGDLVYTAGGSARALAAMSRTSLKEILEEAQSSASDADMPDTFWFLSRLLIQADRVDDLIAVGQHAIALTGEDTNARARVLVHLGSALKDCREPREFIAIAGLEPAAWESQLDDKNIVALAVERSNAVRLFGDPLEALTLLDGVAELVPDGEDLFIYQTNRAILLRESGSPDEALALLVSLEPQARNDAQKHLLYQAFTATAQFAGDRESAKIYARRAHEYSRGSSSKDGPQLEFVINFDSLPDEEISLPPYRTSAVLQLLSAAADVVARLEQGHAVGEDVVAEALVQLRAHADAAFARGDVHVGLNALRVRAAMLDVHDPSAAAAVWQEAAQARGPDRPDPVEQAAIAHHYLSSGDKTAARRHIAAIPAALSAELGGITDISRVIEATGRLRRQLRTLADDVLLHTPTDLQDVLTISELQRDGLGQVIATRRNPERKQNGATLHDLGSLAEPEGHLHVLEWLECSDGTLGLHTTIACDGSITTRAAALMPDHSQQTAKKVSARLAGWSPRQLGDPLDWSPWQEIVEWLHDELATAEPGDHLVVLENSALAGLPWHAVPSATWSTSYAPGWRALLDARAATRRQLKALGHVSIPGLVEGAGIRRAFVHSTSKSIADAARHNLALVKAVGSGADRDAVRRVLANCDLVTIHSHGLASPASGEISLMVAADGRLPPQSSAAVTARPHHRLSWRDLQGSSTSPGIVLSAACSSGLHLVEGLGERLGMFAGLRHTGTRCIVAPAWDCIAKDVTWMLDAIRSRVLDGVPIGEALHHVSHAALNELPPWRALVLTIEGDWR